MTGQRLGRCPVLADRPVGGSGKAAMALREVGVHEIRRYYGCGCGVSSADLGVEPRVTS